MKTAPKNRQQRLQVAAVKKTAAPAPVFGGPVPLKAAAAKPIPPPLPAAAMPADPVVIPSQPPAFQPKVYAAGEIACCHQNPDLTNCGAEAGDPCKWQQTGMEGTFHAERVADAAAASQREGIKPTKEQFDQAAWDSGLF